MSLNPTLSGQFEAESTNSAIICAKPQRAWQSRQLGGPPVVSISTIRATPKALGLLHEVGMAAGIGGAGDA